MGLPLSLDAFQNLRGRYPGHSFDQVLSVVPASPYESGLSMKSNMELWMANLRILPE